MPGAWPIGAVIIWPGQAASLPSGFLICRGQLVAQATYPALFAVTGHRFNRDGGGNPVDPGGGNFKLPDLRRTIPMGPGAGRALGQRGGAFDHVHGPSGAPALAASHGHTRGNLRTIAHWHSHNLYLGDHNHVTSEAVKPLISGSASFRGRSMGARTVGSGNIGLSGGVAAVGEMDVGGATAAAAPAISGSSGPANPPVLTVNFAVRAA